MVRSGLEVVFGCALVAVVRCDFSIQMPTHVETLNGSCALIPCGFKIPESQERNLVFPAAAIWRNGSRWFTGSTDVFNSSRKVNELHGEIVGDLLQKNCTSVLYNLTTRYSGPYYFRLETGFRFTFETPVQIKVVDAPSKPLLSHQSVSVNEDTEVELTCTAPLPCPQQPPRLTWMPSLGNSTETKHKKANGMFTLSSVLRFVSSHAHHGEKVSCTVDYGVQSPEDHSVYGESTAITVLYAPKTQIAVTHSSPLFEGSDVTVICSADANPAVTQIRWFREWQGNVSEENRTETTLTFQMSQEKAGLYYCEAQNVYGKQNSSKVSLEIKERPLEVGYDTLREWNSTKKWLLGCCGAALVLLSFLTAVLSFKRCRSKFMQDWKPGDSQMYAHFDQNAEENFCCRSNEAQQENQEFSTDLYTNIIVSQSKSQSQYSYENSENVYVNSSV